MILLCPILLTMQSGKPPLENAAVVVRHGVVEAYGSAKKILTRFSGQTIYALQDAVVMPGLVNVHTHLELPSLLDEIRAKSFPDWVLNLIRIKRNLSHRDYVTAAQNNIMTLIRTGTTTVGDICTHDVSPSLVKASGIRSVIFRETIGMSPSSSRFRVQSSHKVRSERILNGISPHSPYTVSKEILARIRDSSQQQCMPIAMHVAESKDESMLLQGKKSGLEKLYKTAGWKTEWAPATDSPFDYLNELGLLGQAFLAVHAVQATDRDIALLKKTRTPVAHCPRSNKELGVGKMPLRRFLEAGIIVGLGTDSLASAPNLNMWNEMRFTLSVHKRDGITARNVLELATISGAQALGLSGDIGSIASGKKADIIAVPLPSRNTDDIFSDLLRETKHCIMSMVNGKILYKEQKSVLGI